MAIPPEHKTWAVGLMSFVLLPLLAVPAITQTSSPNPDRQGEENYIYSAIVRHVTEGKRGILFLRIAGKDPSDAVLGRVVRFDLVVAPASTALPDKPVKLLKPLKWRDRKTGLAGELLDLYAVDWVSKKRVRVGSTGNGRNTLVERGHGAFILDKEGGRWQVNHFEVTGAEF